MSDPRFVIRRQNLPTRCEVCHQADQFDPTTQDCLRCQNIQLPPPFEIYEDVSPARVAAILARARERQYMPAPAPAPAPRRRRWSPLDVKLGIAGTVLSLLTVVVTPFYLEAVRNANTAKAVQALHHLHTAEQAYSRTVGRRSYSPNLQNFSGCPHAINSLDADYVCERCVKIFCRESPGSFRTDFGYILAPIETTPAIGWTHAKYSAFVYPENSSGWFQTGSDCFFVDETGVIRHSGLPTMIPNAQSKPLFEQER